MSGISFYGKKKLKSALRELFGTIRIQNINLFKKLNYRDPDFTNLQFNKFDEI